MTERRHLAYVFERFPTFTQTFCVREVLELERQGIRPLIFSLRDTRGEPTQSYPAELRDRVITLPPSDELTETVRQWRADKLVPKAVDHALRFWVDQPDKKRVYESAWIGQKIREVAPEIGHLHGHFAGMAARTMWWMRAFHDFSYSFTAHANDVFCADTETPVSLEMLMRDASLVVTVSDYTVKRLGEQFPGASGKIRRVYNGLDFQKFANASGGEARGIGTRRIYTIGRLIEKKGFDDLIRACGHLRDRGVVFTCHIIGGGPLEDELQALIQRLKLADRVILEGEQDQATIIEQLAQRAHVFALPCVTERDGGMDNLPTVLMEAMAVGLPCVSTRLAGVPEMVEEGKTGLLTNEREPEAFSVCLEHLLDDDARCRIFGQAGHERAHQLFEQAVTARALISELIARGRLNLEPDLVKNHPLGAGRQLLYRAVRACRPGSRISVRSMLEPEFQKSQRGG